MKHIHIKYIGNLIAVILLFAAIELPAQDLSEQIKTSLNTYRVNYAPEKVYIHHDKPYYLAGELLWFKAYVVDANSLESTKRSGVLYVDLIDAQNEQIKRLTLPITDGEAHGDIAIPDDLPEGIYKLSAHTQWMRNFGEEIYFQKEIYILDGNGADNIEVGSVAADTSIDLQFFPESGDLIAGLANEVAFKAVNSRGYSLPISASLFDGEGRKILDFSDHHAGMGSFTFTPEEDKSYFAKVNYKDGQTVDYPLPIVQSTGYILHIDEVADPDHILVKIRGNKDDGAHLQLFAISGQRLIHTEDIHFENQGVEVLINKNDFPSGVAKFTLAKKEGEPLAERLAFVKHREEIRLEVNSDKDVYNTREEVNLSLDLPGLPNDTLARLSMAVTADQLVDHPENKENIYTYMLLSSDLKGHIESPGYYFEGEDSHRQEALRHLMMTQGWRRFDWNSILTQDFPKVQHPNEMDLNIRGRLVNRKGEPIKDGEAILFLKDRFQTFITTTTNKDGYFTFRGFYFTGNIQVVIQGTDDRGRREGVEVQMVEKGYFPLIAENRVHLPKDFVAQLPEDYAISAQQHFEGIGTALGDLDLSELLLEEVVIQGRAEIQQPFRLHTQADNVLYRENLMVSPSGNILESLQGRVAGLQVFRTGMNEFRAVIRGQGTPLYLLDGMPVSEATMQMISQFDISRIEILKNPGAAAIYGGMGGGGVIALYTDTWYEEEVDTEAGKHILVYKVSGFDKARQFYSPKYDNADHYDMADMRSTIYWNPLISLGKENRKNVSFFTADTPGTYRVIIEGVTENGKPIYKEKTFEVR